jgi:hypothetical protein
MRQNGTQQSQNPMHQAPTTTNPHPTHPTQQPMQLQQPAHLPRPGYLTIEFQITNLQAIQHYAKQQHLQQHHRLIPPKVDPNKFLEELLGTRLQDVLQSNLKVPRPELLQQQIGNHWQVTYLKEIWLTLYLSLNPFRIGGHRFMGTHWQLNQSERINAYYIEFPNQDHPHDVILAEALILIEPIHPNPPT